MLEQGRQWRESYNMKVRDDSGENKKSGFSTSVIAGGVALVFLIIGFQTAMFIHKASVAAIVSHRDRPDTVYVTEYHYVHDAEEALSESSVVSGNLSVRRNVPASNGQKVIVGRDTVRSNYAHSPRAEAIYRKYSEKSAESFRFNPNTASVSDLERLGFSEKQARSIVRYREKGGRFRRREDFAKSYVVADSVYRRLEPYIDIPLLDLNLADSAAFDALPGIGGYFASQMVKYRKRLGGSYSFKEQLMEIWKFDKEKYDALSDLVTVSPEHKKPYPIWTLPEDSLRMHPYIGSYAARGVVLYRENNPASAWTVEGLVNAGVIDRENAAKLSRCILK